MSSRKSNKFSEVEPEQIIETVVQDVIATDTEALPVTDVIEASSVVEVVAIDLDTDQAEAERLNQVNDLEKLIIQHQESIKTLRSELKKLDGKSKREGPTKMEVCQEIWKTNAGLSRKEYVQMFITQGGLTQAGARTYIQLILSKNK